ncbi:hypothetical protein [Aquibacillus kalidii]|uniref:hypothetical protein n=1 Tax=Aquibacillus kalidii TaxID=2762597 RepID=UPI001646319E|nr:hypothetical protein [Aquibacillus kalidii]
MTNNFNNMEIVNTANISEHGEELSHLNNEINATTEQVDNALRRASKHSIERLEDYKAILEQIQNHLK